MITSSHLLMKRYDGDNRETFHDGDNIKIFLNGDNINLCHFGNAS